MRPDGIRRGTAAKTSLIRGIVEGFERTHFCEERHWTILNMNSILLLSSTIVA